jgi:hypothetical protein
MQRCRGLIHTVGLPGRGLHFGIGLFSDHVQRDRTKVADVNGLCGVGRRCMVQLRARSLAGVIFGVAGTEAKRSIGQAAERVAQVLARERPVLRMPERRPGIVPASA